MPGRFVIKSRCERNGVDKKVPFVVFFLFAKGCASFVLSHREVCTGKLHSVLEFHKQQFFQSAICSVFVPRNKTSNKNAKIFQA
jgi:hypothetical protein